MVPCDTPRHWFSFGGANLIPDEGCSRQPGTVTGLSSGAGTSLFIFSRTDGGGGCIKGITDIAIGE